MKRPICVVSMQQYRYILIHKLSSHYRDSPFAENIMHHTPKCFEDLTLKDRCMFSFGLIQIRGPHLSKVYEAVFHCEKASLKLFVTRLV